MPILTRFDIPNSVARVFNHTLQLEITEMAKL